MDNNRIIELLARKQANEATPRELEELAVLLTSIPDALYFDEVVREIWTQRGEMMGMDDVELDAFYQAHELKFRKELGFNAPKIENHAAIVSENKRVVPENKIVALYPLFKNHAKLLGVACGIFIIAMAAVFFLKKEAQEFDTTVFSGKGIRKKIQLPDGTVVWLNAESSLSYSSNIDHNTKRRVYLIGEAFFDVSHRQNRPFVVCTEQLSVKVLGTAFNVKAYAKDKEAEATLLRGSIELSMNDKPTQKIILKPSEKFAMIKNLKNGEGKNEHPDADSSMELMVGNIVPIKIAGSEYIEETSWKDNVLVFHNETLEVLKPRLERWFNVHIELSNTLPKSYRFTGALKNENIKEALTAMQLIKPFHFKLKADEVIIY